MLFVCSVAWLFLLGVVSTGALGWLERLVSEMTYNVLMGMLNPTHSLTVFSSVRLTEAIILQRAALST